MHEIWIPGNSFFHRWDARVKLIAVAMMCLTVAAMTGLMRPLMLLVLGLICLMLSDLSPRLLFGRLGSLHLFLIPCFLFLPFKTPGEPWLWIGPVSVTREGIHWAAAIYLRALAIAVLAFGLVLTTPFDIIIQAGERIHLPRILTQIALLAYRFLFTLRTDWRRIRIALITRGFREATRLYAYQTLAHAIGGLMIRTVDRTERVTHAMRCRGYHGTIPTMRTFRTRAADWGALAVTTVLCMMFVLWELTG